MRVGSVMTGALFLSLAAGSLAMAQTPPTATTTPPEKIQGSTTSDNPATVATPAPASVMPTQAGTSNNAVSTAPQNNAGAPVAGANSFTEGEARARIERSGFAKVNDLKLDSKGVWRGMGDKDGKTVNVALDYQGNVVTQ